MADKTHEEAKEKARQAKEAQRPTLAEEEIGVIRIEIRVPGGLLGRPVVGQRPRTDPAGDRTDLGKKRFDPDPTDRDNRAGDTDAD
jgi:hypothetical protein